MPGKIRLPLLVLVAIVTLTLQLGCSKKSVVEPLTGVDSATIEANVAETVANAIGEDNGGLADQFGDLKGVCPLNVRDLKRYFFHTLDSTAVYDEATGIWTKNVNKETGSVDSSNYARIIRTYTLQFFNSGGHVQRYWIVDGDTATVIKFKTLSGSGYCKTRHVTEQLRSISSDLIATNTNTATITVNGSYNRSAIDTMACKDKITTSDYNLVLAFADVKIPRSWNKVSQDMSGTVTGTYDAALTVASGDSLEASTVHRDINITLCAGMADIKMHGKHFRGDIRKGEMKGN